MTREAVLRGLRTAWIAEGPIDAPLLLCLHGYPDTAHVWAPQIDHFKKSFRVIAPFARGAHPSESATDLSRYGLEANALDHLAILRIEDVTGQRPVYLLGHDLGGAQAWHLAPLLGSRLKGMAIINSLPLNRLVERLRTQPSQWLRSWYIYPFLVPAIADPLLRKFPGKLLRMAHNTGKLPPDRRPKLAKTLPGVVNPVKHYRAFLRDAVRMRSTKPLKVRCPVLVIWGEDEPFLNRIHQDELASYADKATIRVLNGGHWLHRESPETVNRILGDFYA